MLEAGAYSFVLQAVDQRRGNIAGDNRIFGIVFIASAGERRAACGEY